MRFFLIFIAFIIVVRIVTEGFANALFALRTGMLFGGRLIIVMVLGLVFSGTTQSRKLQAALVWFFKPIPKIRERNLALMVGLTLRFIPLVFDDAEALHRASAARCGEARRPRIQRLRYLGLPLVLKVFRRVDQVAMAMESRCYDQNAPEPSSTTLDKPSLTMWSAFSILLVTCILVLLLPGVV